ncbi:SPARC-related modular calcium-binding protein 2-like isoform X2 [Penaeus japonicus]|uniref:SPARC-related modular calcium-binding protein 2-like isoform X2 n=1 Tax=Penaeus japonicus TaxID=27405 RepID=UPI001C70BBAA|nr:SPARC-related modular calcium-binding protein 2-like isoform X2 [Penaeus japonicus]
MEKTREDLLRNVDCNVNCQHKSRDPVCGTNGRTYSSRCDLEGDICKKVKVQFKHHGECSLAEKCIDERRAKQEQVNNGEMVFVPTCQPDGSYSPVQCHNFTFYCWCSLADGSPIAKTFQKDERPLCIDPPIKPTEVPSQGKLNAAERQGVQAFETLLSLSTALPTFLPPRYGPKRCSGRKKKSFLNNLTKLLVQGYKRERKSRRRSSQSTERLREPAVRWKFSELDKDNDNQLKRSEYRKVCKTIRNFVEPRRCAKLFPRFCDIDNNGRISRNEWVDCFTVLTRREERRQKTCKKKKCGADSEERKRPIPSCQRERESLLREAENSGNKDFFIPECAANGKYQPIQCYRTSQEFNVTEYCFCMDTETGNSLDGTGVTNGTPNCSRPFPHVRDWQGCMGKTKTKFLKDLQEYLMSEADGADRNAGVDVTTQSREEYAAVYHFQNFDKNGDRVLERKEKKAAKRFLTSVPKLKRCGRRIAKYCDVDKNRKISLEEWVACIVVPENHGNSSGGGVPSEGRRRIEDNPILIHLRAEDKVIRLKYRNW